MSVIFYYLYLSLIVVLEFILFLAIGTPLLYLLFRKLKKKGYTVKKWVKHCTSIFLPMNMAFVVAIYIFLTPYHDRYYELGEIKIPVKVLTVRYPYENNDGDDFNVIKTFKIRKGGLTESQITKIESLCKEKPYLWKKAKNKYVYDVITIEDETHIVITIDPTTNTGIYNYLEW